MFAIKKIIFSQNFVTNKNNLLTHFCNLHVQNNSSLTKIFNIKMTFKHMRTKFGF